jgi:glutamyl-tRNA(Gln) amidotransferase subunit E
MKIGIEIHQRLDCSKLFCECKSDLVEGEPALTIQRRLHPVLSELGEADEASRVEFAKRRIFEYQVFSENNCLVEMDEEPPRNMNSEALKIALEISKHLNATPLAEVQVMRKIVIDGSNTSGFQRTSIVSLNGHIDTSKGPVTIPSIAIEEESAGIVKQTDEKATYRLDRLGIPLVEITTNPDIKDGEHLQETAKQIGMILRATGKVARGLGTIRQDVNISTEGGARVELKGAQDLKMLPTLVEYESKRQLELVKIIHELRSSKSCPVLESFTDVTPVFKETSAKLIRKGLDSGSSVIGQPMGGFAGILGRELQKGKRFGTELSNYAKMAGVKGIIHSDEDLSKYGIADSETKELKKKLGECFILVVAPEEQARAALSHAVTRANMDCVPEETRRANQDGTSSYMRPLPGKARLYPETDVPPIQITEELLESVAAGESLEEKTKKLEKMLNKELASKMLKSRHLHIFERLVENGAEPKLVATTIENTIVSLRREGIQFQNLEESLVGLFEEFSKGTFVKAAIPDVLKGMAKGASAESVIKVFRLQKLSGKELEKLIEEEGYDLKRIMAKHRLQVDPGDVAELIKKKKK